MASLNEAIRFLLELYESGQTTAAIELAGRILAAVPDHTGTWQIRGAALLAAGQPVAAVRAFRSALSCHPGSGSGWSNFANTLQEQDNSGASQIALSAYRRAVILDPAAPDPRANRAGSLKRAGQAAAAVDSCRRALALAPAHETGVINIADAFLGVGSKQDAVTWSFRAVALLPDSGAAWLNLAASLAAADRFAEAAAAAQAALARHPRPASVQETLAGILARLGDGAGADRALAASEAVGGTPTLRRTKAAVHLSLARPRLALSELELLLRNFPTEAGLHWNRATALLQAGDWAEGWRAFEWRRHDDRAQPPWRDLEVPTWNGAPLAGRTLLLYAEQGWGDALQMLRFIPVVAEMGGRIIIEVMSALVPLVRRITTGLPSVVTVVARGAALPSFDLECPLMSLPGVLGVRPDAIAGQVPFLTPDPIRAGNWRARLIEMTGQRGLDPGGLKVGLVWAGNNNFADDRRRSPRLPALMPLLATPGITFLGLQKGAGRDDLMKVSTPANFIDLGKDLTDIDDTAAVISQLDLMISSCTMPAHLAGGLGVPLWLLLCHAPDWRWLLDRDDSPWYPTATLFRQPSPGDWGTPVAAVASRLSALASGKTD